jgi:Tol biopolymer transport system component
VESDNSEDMNYHSTRIWVVDFLPSIETPEPLGPESRVARNSPAWSADGSCLFYMHQLWLDGPWTIYKIALATGVEEQVVTAAYPEGSPIPAGEYSPKLSSDGSKIAWTSFRHGMNGGDIYVADLADPMNSQLRVTPYSGWSAASWSPDGQQLVMVLVRFKLTKESFHNLRLIGFADGLLAKLKNVNIKFVTEKQFLENLNAACGAELTASRRYTIQQNATWDWDLWITSADGSGLKRLTSGSWVDQSPWWGNLFQPDTDLAITSHPLPDTTSVVSRLSYRSSQ